MRLPESCVNFTKLVIILSVVLVLPGVVAACADFGQYPVPTPAAETPETKPAVTTTTIGTEDTATRAVYEYLLSKASSYQAKEYLAEFYTTCDNWAATLERSRDGSSLWYVVVDMTGSQTWEGRPYWRQAGWFVYRDGRVIPSDRLQANALRIEADLQELSQPAKP